MKKENETEFYNKDLTAIQACFWGVGFLIFIVVSVLSLISFANFVINKILIYFS